MKGLGTSGTKGLEPFANQTIKLQRKIKPNEITRIV
jgi:hypothetical protein